MLESSLPEAAQRTLRSAAAYHEAGYSPHAPYPKQLAGLLLPHREILYGGAAGGGKSDWLLMCALQYVDIPGYAALMLRRTFSQLSKAEGLIPRAHDWLTETDAEWSEKFNRWTFPSGAVIEFGHMQYENDKYNYLGAAYQCVCFDELTNFSETQYRYLNSRMRRPKDASLALSQVPIRMRSGSNPGGVGHDWVKRRFITGRKKGRAFVPAKLTDNLYLDQDEYIESLNELDPITRAQLLDGDWTARAAGGFFKREWIGDSFVDSAPVDARPCRGWDLASTKARPGTDPDWTVGARVAEKDGRYYVGPLVRGRYSPNELDRVLASTANIDGVPCKVRIEEEGGSAGKITTAHFIKLLAGFDVRGIHPTGPKLSRFSPFASQCEAGNVSFVNGPWVGDCIDELEALQADDSHAHDDQADAIALAFNDLASQRSGWALMAEQVAA